MLVQAGPMVLLADSQLLFGGRKGEKLADWVKAKVSERCLASGSSKVLYKALYIGAANGDIPEFFQMAVDICRGWGIGEVIHATDTAIFDQYSADDVGVIILAGGDVELGWRFLSLKPVRAWLDAYSQHGGLSVGISAGAIHLASAFSKEHRECIDFLGFYPARIAVHEEKVGWPTVDCWHQWYREQKGRCPPVPLVAIPMGGGLLWDSKGVIAVGRGYESFSVAVNDSDEEK